MSTPPYLVTGVGSHLKANPLLSCGIRARNLSLVELFGTTNLHQRLTLVRSWLKAAVVVSTLSPGNFTTLMTELPSCSPEAAERFYADSRRFPPGSYESHSLLWRRDEWRQPNSAERCATMCIPPAAVMSVNTPPAKREQQRNSLIGNGFHIPSIMILLRLLPHLLQAKFVHPTIDPGDGVLQARFQGTVWEPGRLDVWPHLLDAADVVRLLPTCFAHLAIPDELLSQVHHRLAHCRLSRLQEFAVWQEMRGEPFASLGPTPIFGRDRTFIYSGLSGQRYPSSSSRGLDHLLPPGLGVEAHMGSVCYAPFTIQSQTLARGRCLLHGRSGDQMAGLPHPSCSRTATYPSLCGPGVGSLGGLVGDYALPQCCYGGCVQATSFLCYTLEVRSFRFFQTFTQTFWFWQKPNIC